MPVHPLSRHFEYFFGRVNPSTSFVDRASSEYNTVRGLIENPLGPAAALAPQCFLQGSYGQQTAIHTINDVDIVALCKLWQPAAGGGGGVVWDRDRIFATIAAPLWADGRYRDKVRFGPTSMCVKLDLGIKLEILPVVFRQGNGDPANEPFRLWRPEHDRWEDGYARLHRSWLSYKNAEALTGGNFIPAIKVFKHLRSLYHLDAISFHLECFLFRVLDAVYTGAPADYIPTLLRHIAGIAAETWYLGGAVTPCGERNIFTVEEWAWPSWKIFHDWVKVWATLATTAQQAWDRAVAIPGVAGAAR